MADAGVPRRSIDYATPPATVRKPIGPSVWLSSWIVFDAIILSAVLLLAARFERLFKDLNVNLPLISQIWLRTARWFLNDYGWFYLWTQVAIAITLILVFRPSLRATNGSNWPRRVMWYVFLLGWTIPVSFAVLAAILPMQQ